MYWLTELHGNNMLKKLLCSKVRITPGMPFFHGLNRSTRKSPIIIPCFILTTSLIMTMIIKVVASSIVLWLSPVNNCTHDHHHHRRRAKKINTHVFFLHLFGSILSVYYIPFSHSLASSTSQHAPNSSYFHIFWQKNIKK